MPRAGSPVGAISHGPVDLTWREAYRSLIAKHGVQFPVGRSADAHAIAHATGVFVNPDPVYL